MMRGLKVKPGELWTYNSSFIVYTIERGKTRNSWRCLIVDNNGSHPITGIYEYGFTSWDDKNTLWEKLV